MAIVYRIAKTEEERRAAYAVRHRVFVEEQGIDARIERDEADERALHVVAWNHERAIGTGRLVSQDGVGRVGRMAVLPAFRGQGIGSALLRFLVDEAARRGLVRVVLHAQAPTVDFYRRAGFEPQGEPFFEAGIEHVAMVRHVAVGQQMNL